MSFFDSNDLLNTNSLSGFDISDNIKEPYLSKITKDLNDNKYTKLKETTISIDSRNRINGNTNDYKITFNTEFKYISKIDISKSYIPEFKINNIESDIKYVLLELYVEGESGINLNGNLLNSTKNSNNNFFAKIPLSSYKDFIDIKFENHFYNNFINKITDLNFKFYNWDGSEINNMPEHTFNITIYEVSNMLKDIGFDSRINTIDQFNIVN